MRHGESMRASDVRLLPIVSAYARAMGVVEEIDRLCSHEREISPSRIVLALMVDALSGSTYREEPQNYTTVGHTEIRQRFRFSLEYFASRIAGHKTIEQTERRNS